MTHRAKKLFLLLTLVILPLTTLAQTKLNTIANQLIQKYHLKPLMKEGGYFSRTYFLCQSKHCQHTKKPDASAIYFLLTAKDKSVFHLVKQDEIFHFYAGQPVTMVQIRPNGKLLVAQLGSDVLHHQRAQIIVPRNTWQGLILSKGGSYAFMGTTMTPGFVNMKIAQRNTLLHQYPKAKKWILLLTDIDERKHEIS